MAHWHYFNKNGEKVGPISVAALKTLGGQGLITRETLIENHTGRTLKAGEVNGLTFPEITRSETPPPEAAPKPATPPPPSDGEVYGLASPQSTMAPPVNPVVPPAAIPSDEPNLSNAEKMKQTVSATAKVLREKAEVAKPIIAEKAGKLAEFTRKQSGRLSQFTKNVAIPQGNAFSRFVWTKFRALPSKWQLGTATALSLCLFVLIVGAMALRKSSVLGAGQEDTAIRSEKNIVTNTKKEDTSKPVLNANNGNQTSKVGDDSKTHKPDDTAKDKPQDTPKKEIKVAYPKEKVIEQMKELNVQKKGELICDFLDDDDWDLIGRFFEVYQKVIGDKYVDTAVFSDTEDPDRTEFAKNEDLWAQRYFAFRFLTNLANLLDPLDKQRNYHFTWGRTVGTRSFGSKDQSKALSAQGIEFKTPPEYVDAYTVCAAIAVTLTDCADNESYMMFNRKNDRAQALAKVRYRGHLNRLKEVHADLFEIADGATKGEYADLEKARAKFHSDKQKKDNMF